MYTGRSGRRLQLGMAVARDGNTPRALSPPPVPNTAIWPQRAPPTNFSPAPEDETDVRLPVAIQAAAAVLVVGSASSQQTAAQEAVQRPLAAFASRPVLVLPTRYLGPDGPLGWNAQISDPTTFLGDVDAEIAFALEQRGLKNSWIFPPAIVRSVRRNPTFATDPHDLSAESIRPPVKKPPEQLPEPFGSQVRSLVAFQEGAQYVLYPVEVRFEPVEAAAGSGGAGSEGEAAAAAGEGRAVLRVVLLDARRSRVVWMADVASDPYPSFSPALAASAAEHLAELIAKR